MSMEKQTNILGKSLMRKSKSDDYYGLKGLSKIMGCSISTSLKLKKTGIIPFSQIGRKIIFNKQEVIKAIREHYSGPNKPQ
jgi:hypothetical protein